MMTLITAHHTLLLTELPENAVSIGIALTQS